MLHRARRAIPYAVIAVLFAGVGFGGAHAVGAKTYLPKGFRSWTHVKSMAVTDRGHGMYGFHNVYANPEALKGLRARTGRYPAGATFVVSIYEVERKETQIDAGAKRRDVVQIKDPTATATRGWRFASFDPGGKPIAIDVAGCVACHESAKSTDLVFATYTE